MTEILRATPENAEDICGLIYPGFFGESTFSGMTYDPEQTLEQVNSWIGGLCLIAVDDGKVVGFTAATAFRSFFKDPEMAVEIFYVSPEYRGRGISRALVDGIVSNAEAYGIKMIQTSCLSGMGVKNDAVFCNLWGKFGFKKLGTVLLRGGNE